MIDAIERHQLVTLVINNSTLLESAFDIVADFESLFLALFTEVLLLESFRVFDLHVHWIVQQSLLLHRYGQLVHDTLSVLLRLLLPLPIQALLLGYCSKSASTLGS